MTDDDFRKLIIDKNEAGNSPKYFSLPLKNIQKNNINEVHTKCPHCKQISVNKNFYLPPNFSRSIIYCKKCGKVYHLFSQKDWLIFTIFRIIGTKKIYNMNPVIKKVLKRIFNVK